MTYRSSIVIRTYNEARDLGSTLDEVLAQDPPPHEVLVIDSGSTDASVEIARSRPVQVLEIPREEWGYSHALNVAAWEATGDVLVCLSAHCLPVHRRWLANLTRHFDDPAVAGVWGPGFRPGRPLPSVGPPTRQLPGSYTSATRSWGLNNANSAIRRSLWLDQPFDELLPAAEDKAWGMAAMEHGYQIVHDPAAGVYHARHSVVTAFRRAKAVERGFARMFPGEDASATRASATVVRAARDRVMAQLREPDLRQLRRDARNGISAASAVLGIQLVRLLRR